VKVLTRRVTLCVKLYPIGNGRASSFAMLVERSGA
jgi:hypothetical protein